MEATKERTRLVLSRKPEAGHDSVTIFAGGEEITIRTNLRTVLVFSASPDVKIVRTELLDKSCEGIA